MTHILESNRTSRLAQSTESALAARRVTPHKSSYRKLTRTAYWGGSTRHRGREAAGAGRYRSIVVGWLKRSKELPTLCTKQDRKG
jgi:hypothetical protein